MTENLTKTAVPTLRFPEFREAEGWEEKPLATTLHEHRLKSDSKSEVFSVSVHKGLVNQVEHLGRSFAAADTSKYNLVMPFDIVYTKSPTGDFPYGIVKQNLTDRNVIVSPLYGVFSPPNKYVGYLIHCYFEHPIRTNNYLVSLVQKGAKNTIQISNERFLSKGIYLPSSEDEQRRTAETLWSLDDLIAAESEKLQALQTHKRGLMQGLFPAEGETVPRLRFGEFEGDWVASTLGALTSKVGSGITPSGGDKNYKKFGRPFIRSQNVGWGELLLEDVAFIDESTHATFPATEIQEHDVLLNITGASIGRATIADLRIKGGNVNQHVCIIRTNDKLNPLFLSQYLISERGQKQIDSFQAGGNRQGLNFQQIRSFEIPMPPTTSEQQKIAATLSSLDALLTAQSETIEALKLHKKGLMQGLFPA